LVIGFDLIIFLLKFLCSRRLIIVIHHPFHTISQIIKIGNCKFIMSIRMLQFLRKLNFDNCLWFFITFLLQFLFSRRSIIVIHHPYITISQNIKIGICYFIISLLQFLGEIEICNWDFIISLLQFLLIPGCCNRNFTIFLVQFKQFSNYDNII